MGNMIMAVYDGEECVHQRVGESDTDYEARMVELDAKLDSRMSDNEKRQVDELMADFEEFMDEIEKAS
ncbi:MAG: hypothetical protein LBI54_01755 [Lachnospiraceae bacterium]|jgi:hypothetical protein|nr:hypothetical protein [Lachnospiraceae bacterium]